MLSSLDKLSSNLSKDQFREAKKYLESFYVEQRNQTQTNNVTESGEEGEAMYIYEDYQNHSYQLSTLTSDQQQQIEEDLALITQKGVYPSEYMNSFKWFQEPQLPSKDARLHPRPKGVQPLRHDRPRRLSQLLSVNQCAFTGWSVWEF